MATEKRLIDVNELIEALPIVTEDKQVTLYGAVADFIVMISAMPTVDAVILPYEPRPMLKDTENPYNTDVYCPECGTNLSGYYGDEPLPIVTCFNCGEILDPYKATIGTNGERKDNGRIY